MRRKSRRNVDSKNAIVENNRSQWGITITEIPPHIQITRIPETKEDRLKREQELARRKEAAKNCEGIVPSPIKRKHSERMTLEDVKRDDFEETQDYVDFIQSKLKKISIKQCK